MSEREKVRQVLELLRRILEFHEKFCADAKSPSADGKEYFAKIRNQYELLPDGVKKKLTKYPRMGRETFPTIVRKLIDIESKEQLKRAIVSYEKRLQNGK